MGGRERAKLHPCWSFLSFTFYYEFVNVIPRAILKFVFISVKISQFIITRCVIFNISSFILLKWRKKRLTIKLATWNCLFFDFELATRKWTNKSLTIELLAQMQVSKSLTIELVTRRFFFVFQVRISLSKVGQ